jgi:OOP family OmpA-OmpF porin
MKAPAIASSNTWAYRSRGQRAAMAALVCFVSSACVSYDVGDARFAGLRHAIDQATRAGAYRCAPRELAFARAHLDFATLELEQGDPSRAQQHLVEAESNAGAARLLSPPERCEHAAAAAPVLTTQPEVDDRDADGVADADDRCPFEREDRDGHLDADGCDDTDNDADDVRDLADACPDKPEDRDGFEDEDGCPEADNDGDGFEDPADDCPIVPGDAASQGCPDHEYKGVTITEKELRLATPLEFERGTATIRSVSFPVLEVVAQVLRDRSRLTIEIGAHIDSQGDDAKNTTLTQQQADAVREHLVARGIDPTRLTARGYGETRPIESNSTSRGRVINRRIELVRTDRAR